MLLQFNLLCTAPSSHCSVHLLFFRHLITSSLRQHSVAPNPLRPSVTASLPPLPTLPQLAAKSLKYLSLQQISRNVVFIWASLRCNYSIWLIYDTRCSKHSQCNFSLLFQSVSIFVKQGGLCDALDSLYQQTISQTTLSR